MEWVQSINKAIEYMEEHLTEDIHCEDVSSYVHISSFHFQRMFNVFTGMTVGEYIRKRRLSLAGEELTRQNTKVIDVAFKYAYQSPESFAKAFAKFHGINPSQVKKGNELKFFHRLVVKISVEGGTIMDYRIEKKEAFRLLVYAKKFTEESSRRRDSCILGRVLSKGNIQKGAGVFRDLCTGKRRRERIYVRNRMRCG